MLHQAFTAEAFCKAQGSRSSSDIRAMTTNAQLPSARTAQGVALKVQPHAQLDGRRHSAFSPWLQQSSKAAPPWNTTRSPSSCGYCSKLMLRFQFFATGTKAALGCSRVMDKRDWSFENRAGCLLYPKPEFMAMVVTLRYRGTKPRSR